MTIANHEPPTLADLLADYRADLATRTADGAAKRRALAARDARLKDANAKRGMSWLGRLHALTVKNPNRTISYGEIESYGEQGELNDD